MACNKSLINNFSDLSVFSDVLLLHDVHDELTFSGKLEDIRLLNKFVNKHKIDTAVINTLEYRKVKNLLLFSMFRVKNIVGIVHYGIYIRKSGTFKRLYRRVKKVLLLSNNIVKKIEVRPHNVFLSSFYPIYFPSLDDYVLEKPVGEFWLSIPGGTLSSHRDILHLFDKMEEERLLKNVKIILLGWVEDIVKERIFQLKEKGIDNVISFDGRIPQNLMNAYMMKTDIVLPLILRDFYGDYRISGTYNLAYAFKKPMLLENGVQQSNEDFTDISIAYDRENIIKAINAVSISPEKLKKYEVVYEKHPYLTVEKQCEKFIEIIEKR